MKNCNLLSRRNFLAVSAGCALSFSLAKSMPAQSVNAFPSRRISPRKAPPGSLAASVSFDSPGRIRFVHLDAPAQPIPTRTHHGAA